MAMRTATPLATCRVTTVRGRSATSEAISTPAHHRAGMGDDRVRPGARPGRAVRPVRGVLAQAGPNDPAAPLGLQAEERDDVGVTGRVVEVGGHLHRPALEGRRQQAARCGQGDLGAEGGVGQHLGAGHPAVADVADDEDA